MGDQPDNPGAQRTVSLERIVRLLREGDLEEASTTLPWSSNYAYLLLVRDDELQAEAIYKPRRGERPLWDFPDGTLYRREIAAYVVSEALGWGFVPPTVERDGPYGTGMLQLRVQADTAANYFTLGPEFRPQLQRIALFDHVVNNSDRKAGHCLLTPDGRLWSIDHGICFHLAPKLRTVIWDFAAEPIPASLLADLEAFCEQMTGEQPLRTELERLLNRREVAALDQRVRHLLETKTYPPPGPGRNYPWPPV